VSRLTRSTGPRLALAGLYHESNTFAPSPTGDQAFELGGTYHGGDLADAFAGTSTAVGGFLELGSTHDVELVPVFFALANPAGPIAAATFARLLTELLERLSREGPWSGVLLALHGAAVAEGEDDVDGLIVERVRALVGDHVPVGVCLDMHANVSTRMVERSTVTVAYRTNPHMDAAARAVECAELVLRTVRGEIEPVQALARPPLVVNILRQRTSSPPLAALVAEVDAIESTPPMLSASLALGFPYADVPDLGVACLAVADGDRRRATEAARRMAAAAWSARPDLQGEALDTDAAMERATDGRAGPVLLLDTGDNVGGGSPGDSTTLLHEARRRGVRAYLETLCDPEAVRACAGAGVGAAVSIDVGGRRATHSPPCPVSGIVRAVGDGRFSDASLTHGGFRDFDTGPTAVLQTDLDQTLVLTSHAVMDTSVERHRSLGIRPEAKQVVVAKGVQSPLPAYEPLASDVVFVATPGITSADLGSFTYRRRPRPLYPFEADTAWTATE
jgi:microcystin degradation protein MlrC